MSILWVTSFATDMAAVSGVPLVQSFLANPPPGRLLVCGERLDDGTIARLAGEPIDIVDIAGDKWLDRWLRVNADVIPADLGGTHDGVCRCPGGPYASKHKRHVPRCPAAWFCRNASRWVRKIVAWSLAVQAATAAGIPTVVWVDADCRFLRPIPEGGIEALFRGRACFYLKSKRPVLESGIVGFSLTAGAAEIVDRIRHRYATGAFRRDPRWDDSYALQYALGRLAPAKSIDLAVRVGEHAEVVSTSPLGEWLSHAKGAHSRIHGIMT